MNKPVKKAIEKRKATGRPFGPDNPPPISPGRPRKDRTPEDPRIDPSLPVKFGEARAAMEWTFEAGLPKHAGIRLFVLMLRRSPKEFYAELTRLERDWEASKVPVVAVEAKPDPLERVDCAVTERIVGEMEAWLERHRLKALERAEKIERGEKA